MENSDPENQGAHPDYSHDAPITKEMIDEPLKQQVSECQMGDDESVQEVREGRRAETSSGSENNKSEQVSQLNVEQYKESMQNMSEELSESTEMEQETVVAECQKEIITQAPIEMAEDVETEELSASFETVHCWRSIEKVIGKVLSELPDEGTTSSLCDEVAVFIKEQNASESDKHLEVERELEEIKKPKRELLVQQAQQAVELIYEEAVICDAKQERMEEATDIEEPQKYAFREKDG